MSNDDRPSLFLYGQAADELHRQETARLAASIVPTLDSLRFLNSNQLRARVADMLERLGYQLMTPETATDLLAMKDGKKYVIAFASTLDQQPTQANQLTRLHSAVIAGNADAGFYITTRGFSRDAEAYAATAPLKLVDGPKLVASIKRSMQDVTPLDTYRAMCRQCGEVVTHQLDKPEAKTCSAGHTVPPTIARAAIAPRRQEGVPRSFVPQYPLSRSGRRAGDERELAVEG